MTVPVFPTLSGLTYPAKRVPFFLTDKHRTVTGKRTALANYSYPVWNYELEYSFLRSDSVNLEWQTLAAFFLRVYGDANVWQFNDPDDTSVTDQSFGTGDGVTTDYQLVRTLTGSGANIFVEPVWAPLVITNVKIAGAPTAAYTTNGSGLISFNAAPANGAALTWTGTYNWLCRFDDGMMDFQKFAYQFWDLKQIAFSTEKL